MTEKWSKRGGGMKWWLRSSQDLACCTTYACLALSSPSTLTIPLTSSQRQRPKPPAVFPLGHTLRTDYRATTCCCALRITPITSCLGRTKQHLSSTASTIALDGNVRLQYRTRAPSCCPQRTVKRVDLGVSPTMQGTISRFASSIAAP